MEKISLLDLISICFVCSLPVFGICEVIDRIKNEKTNKEFSLSNPFGDYFPYKRTLKYVEKLD